MPNSVAATPDGKGSAIISVKDVHKTYDSGFTALKGINLEIHKGEIFSLLGPNGAGKTTLIGIICSTVNASQGSVTVGGYDIIDDYRKARSLIGLVPQELTSNVFETVWNTVTFSRGLFGKPKDPDHIERVLRSLSLWDKKDSTLLALSGGMKRRVMIAKALSHEPEILFLDEPTAGVDVQLRRSMWDLVHDMRRQGVTIFLTTHYIEEAEEMSDRVGVISSGELIEVEEKTELMKKLGKKELIIELVDSLDSLPQALSQLGGELIAPNSDSGETASAGQKLRFSYQTKSDTEGRGGVVEQMLSALQAEGIRFRDITTKESSLEDIFVKLVK